MQYLENDMDELFQRAAENFSLKNDKGDWESVAKRIPVHYHSKDVSGAMNAKKNKKKVIVLLLIFFIALAGWLSFNLLGKSDLKFAGGFTKENVDENISSRSNPRNAVVTSRTNLKDISGRQGTDNISRQQIVKSVTSVTKSIKIKSQASPHPDVKGDHSKDVGAEKKFSNRKAHDGVMEVPQSANVRSITQIEMAEIFIVNTEAAPHLSNSASEAAKSDAKNKDALAGNAQQSNKITVATQKRKGFYIGLSAALDFSKVEKASFDNSGFDAGAILGFRLNTAFSFETGIAWNKKNYFSDGKYFSMDKVGSTMPSGMVINTLESKSSLIEIPLKVKYDFLRKPNADLFLTGGVSSYIMTKESNRYNVTLNGATENVSGVYKNDNYGTPAVANFSIGYEHSFYRALSIRIEPFLKIPVHGMGVGNLSVTSAGLQVSLTGHLK